MIRRIQFWNENVTRIKSLKYSWINYGMDNMIAQGFSRNSNQNVVCTFDYV